MKISDATLNHLTKSFAKTNSREIFPYIFLSKIRKTLDFEFKLTTPVYNELINVTKKEYSEYDCSYVVGEKVTAHIGVPELDLFIRMAGDPEPYSEDPDEETDFDAIGEWIIDLRTKEITFYVDITT